MTSTVMTLWTLFTPLTVSAPLGKWCAKHQQLGAVLPCTVKLKKKLWTIGTREHDERLDI
jgi:hypothetical protein